MDTIIASVITGVLTLVGVVFTVSQGNRSIEKKLEIQQAVTDCKIDELTRETRMHNNYVTRVPVLEEQMKVANHRIEDLEKRAGM